MNNIHPSALVSSKAQISANVTIGPYSIVNENVIIGNNTTIGSHTIISGHTTIGNDNYIGHHSIIGDFPQDMKYAKEPTKLIIGNNNTIREFVTIHTGTVQDKGLTKVGNSNWIMSYVHLAHDCVLGDNIIISNNAQLAGHVEVDDYAVIGGMSGIHQFVRIGAHSMIGGSSALVQDVPPYVMAAGQKAIPHGVNTTGLLRRGFTAEDISHIKHLYKIVYRESLILEEAKQEMQNYIDNIENEMLKLLLQVFKQFICSSQRGIVR